MSARLTSLILANSLLVGASLGFIGAGGSPSFAAIYMKIADIKGEVQQQGYKDWIEIDSFSGAEARIGATKGASPTAASGPGTISVTRRSDSSTAALMQYCMSKRAIAKVEIDVVEAQSAKYVLQNAIISSCQGPGQGAGAGGLPTESISLNYEKMLVSYGAQDTKQKSGGGIPKGFDVNSAKK